jgi:hypothetical protein
MSPIRLSTPCPKVCIGPKDAILRRADKRIRPLLNRHRPLSVLTATSTKLGSVPRAHPVSMQENGNTADLHAFPAEVRSAA